MGESTFPDGLTTTYAYETASGDLAGQLTQRDNLASITDARGIDWLDLTYTDASGDGRVDEVTTKRPGAATCSRSRTTSPPAPRRSPTGGTTPGRTSTTPTATRPR